MRTNLVRQALKEGKVQLGTSFGNFRSPEIPRLLKAAGFQWAFVDTEHGTFSYETVQDICRVAHLVDFCPVVRVADFQYGHVARSLDAGAGGIMFPRVESPEPLATALTWTKFPPLGARGFGLNPSHSNYEPGSFNQVIDHVNANVLTVVQIESKRAVEAREEILSVPGIDAVMIGPADLSVSLGVAGDMNHPTFIDAIEKVRDTCDRKGIAPGTHTRSVEMGRFWKQRGMRFIGCGNDLAFLYEKASDTAKAVMAD